MSRTLYIPNIGDSLTLHQHWTFDLYPEHRNIEFAKKLQIYDETKNWKECWPKGVPHFPVTIPAGTVLIVDRIYIRKGNADFSSVTFRLKKETSDWGTGRFWAKLNDVNKMEILVEANDI